MRTHRDFYRHRATGEIYAVEITWDSDLVGSAGPLPENNLQDLDSYEYTPDLNKWIAGSDKLILMDAEDKNRRL
ncbi:MAG: hypothetical protein ACYTEQ_11460 [Planctomycetota bacterium]|jgi:hypothetical protein